jgi:chromate transport protein ChrA
MSAIAGTLAAAVGMMATGAWQLLAGELRTRNVHAILRALAFAGAALLLTWRFQMAPIAVLALAAAVGFLWQGPAKA